MVPSPPPPPVVSGGKTVHLNGVCDPVTPECVESEQHIQTQNAKPFGKLGFRVSTGSGRREEERGREQHTLVWALQRSSSFCSVCCKGLQILLSIPVVACV